MLDFERLIYGLLKQSLPDVQFAPNLDVSSLDRLPLVTFSIASGGAVEGSPAPPFAWTASLALSVFDDGIDRTRALTARVYEAVWSWDDPWQQKGVLAGVGHATAISDAALFTRTATVEIGARFVSQYDGLFDMQLHRA